MIGEVRPVRVVIVATDWGGDEDRIGGNGEDDRAIFRKEDRAGGGMVVKVDCMVVPENDVRCRLSCVSEEREEIVTKELKVIAG